MLVNQLVAGEIDRGVEIYTPILKRGDYMVKSDVTDTVKRRLKYNNICPICNGVIKDYQDFQYVTFRRGANMCYRFFHTFCLVETDDREEMGGINYG